MKVSEQWLREWANPSLTSSELAAQLTMAGLEVDAVYPVAGEFSQVIVARVLRTKPHPEADKLTICEVQTQNEAIAQVVCGASNVRPELMVAMAVPGAQLPGGMVIKEAKLRGELSQGMLCSASELGLEESSQGILELPNDAPLGIDFREYLSLNDHVLDIDLTPNRADCFSVLGVARDVAALNKVSLSPLPTITNKLQTDETLTIKLQAPEACPRYFGRIIREINTEATTPMWMQERLRRAGIRRVHPVVDVTNYVMLEFGQPMHAFDLETIETGINVRYNHKNESLVLLDGQEITLDEKVLVIADKHKALAIAGVMGGEASSVQVHTKNIFLESAYFNPVTIAGIARKYGLNSDSSQRFERGVDPLLQERALERATELLLEIVGGKIGPVICAEEPSYVPKKMTIPFSPEKVNQITGVNVPIEEMQTILTGLGMQVNVEKEVWQVAIPSYRFDLSLDVDLVEEIIRIFGYDNIKAEPLSITMQAGKLNHFETLTNQMTAFLSSRAYLETINYSFVDPQLQEELYPAAKTMQLLNPISSELSQMRVSLWPGLIAALVYNTHRQQSGVKFFESGVIFDLQGKELRERRCIAGLLYGEQSSLNWSELSRKVDFFDAKGDLQALMSGLNFDVKFVSAEHSALHPGKSAQIMLNNEIAVGWLGALHPRFTNAIQLEDEVILFEIFLEPLLEKTPIRYQSISKYPQIRRDLSLLVNNEIEVAEIERAVRAVVSAAWLKSFDVFDVYSGSCIPEGKKSIAIALTLQDDKRTLIDGEINNTIDAIIKTLNDKFAIVLRE